MMRHFEMRRLCFVTFCAVVAAILCVVDGFQHQQLRSQKSPFQSAGITGITNCETGNPRTTSLPPSTRTTTTKTTQLHALPSLSASPLGALTVLAGIVVVHEAGHYLAARAFNITVEEFSVGFGPKLAGFEAFENDFNLRALPLGGYVRFPENYDGEAVQEIEQLKRTARRTIKRRENELSESDGWNWKDEILNAATLGFWEERSLDEKRKEKSLERQKKKFEAEQSRPFWAKLFGGNTGTQPSKKKTVDGDEMDIDEIYESLDELESYEVEYYDDPQLLQNRPWPERAVVLSGGVIFNLLLALSIYFAAIGPLPVGDGLPRAVFDDGVVVKQAPRSDGPSSGLLRQGDIITGINGRRVQIAGSTKTSVTAGQRQVSDVISVIRATPDGGSVSVDVLRAEDGGEGTKTKTAQTIQIRPSRSDGVTQTIGVMLGPNFDRLERLKSSDPVVALQLAWQYLSEIFMETLAGTVSVLAGFLSPSGAPPGQQISGPIGLISQGSGVVATKDLTAVLLFAAGLSVNLGVINALPLPALDGGQLVFVVAEAITGKKVDQKFQESVTSIAILFLLYLSLSAAIGDVGNILK